MNTRTYNTLISEIEKDLNITLGLEQDMILGEWLKQNGYKDLADILQM